MGYCPDDVHMDKDVQIKVQVEEEEIREKNTERKKVENKERDNDQVAHMGDHADDMTRTNTFLSHAM